MLNLSFTQRLLTKADEDWNESRLTTRELIADLVGWILEAHLARSNFDLLVTSNY